MWRALAWLALSVVVAAIVFMPVCDLLFHCGCAWPWAGGVSHCNIHNPGPPHCPLCEGSTLLRGAVFLAIASPLFLAGRRVWRRHA